MDRDLSFVQHEGHRALLREIVEAAVRDPQVSAAIVYGSVARGEAYARSDLDVMLLLTDGCSRPFRAEMRGDILVEVRCADRAEAERRLATNDMEPYFLIEGRVLHDPRGAMAELRAMARQRLAAYRPPAKLCADTGHWLGSAAVKIAAAREAGDLFRAAYVASTTSWKILEGVWLANGRPIPAGGGVWAHLRDLGDRPPEEHLAQLFLADAAGRVDAALELIHWVLNRLPAAGEGTGGAAFPG